MASQHPDDGVCLSPARRVYAELRDTAVRNSKYPYYECRHFGNTAGHTDEYQAAPAAWRLTHIAGESAPVRNHLEVCAQMLFCDSSSCAFP